MAAVVVIPPASIKVDTVDSEDVTIKADVNPTPVVLTNGVSDGGSTDGGADKDRACPIEEDWTEFQHRNGAEAHEAVELARMHNQCHATPASSSTKS